jgi:hypothetical protein
VIEDAQVTGFECRLGVRKTDKPALAACRKSFRGCVQVCPPGTGSVDDPKQCRKQAVMDDKTCLGLNGCLGDFQFAKDTCRNKDHDCVDACRATRDACDVPVQTTLDQTIAACEAQLKTAVAACNQDPMCITQAQVVAFQCREDAHEAARPEFAACETSFRSCAQACPPAASPSGAFLN